MYDDLDDLPRNCEVPFEIISDEDFLLDDKNEECPMYMGLEDEVPEDKDLV